MTLDEMIEAVQAAVGVSVDDDPGLATWTAIYNRICGPAPQPAPAGEYLVIADGNHNDPWPPPEGMPAFIHKASEGTFFADPLCAARMGAYTGKRGFYHFSSGENPGDQAAHFLAAMAVIGYRPTDLICLDFEESSRSGDGNMTSAGAEMWIAAVEKALGCVVCVYGSDLLTEALEAGCFVGRPLWPASYRNTPPSLPGGRQWAIWQYTGNGAGLYSDLDKISASNLAAWPNLTS